MADNNLARTIAAANVLVVMAQKLLGLMTIIDQLVAGDDLDCYAAVWASLATSAVEDDGSLGAADSAPVPGHAIDNRVYPTLLRPVPAVQLTEGMRLCRQLQNMFMDRPVEQDNYRQVIDDLAV